jgi:hypothetical protein
MVKTYFYKLKLSQSFTCADILPELEEISKPENLALGLVGKALRYYSKDGNAIYFSFTPMPMYHHTTSQEKADELLQKFEQHLDMKSSQFEEKLYTWQRFDLDSLLKEL